MPITIKSIKRLPFDIHPAVGYLHTVEYSDGTSEQWTCDDFLGTYGYVDGRINDDVCDEMVKAKYQNLIGRERFEY